MGPRSLQSTAKFGLSRQTHTYSSDSPINWIPPQIPSIMNPAEQHAPSLEELCFMALEQALTNSQAERKEMQKQLTMLLDCFQKLKKLFAEQQTPANPPMIPVNVDPIWTTPTGWPPPHALPTEFDGDQTHGQAFLSSCQTYICLYLDSFPSDKIKITWVLSYMKSRRAAKWAARVLKWEEDNEGYLKFLDWDEFWTEFQKDFCPAHAEVAAINKLDSTTYYQKTRSVDNYLDEFVDLIMEAGYMDPKITVVKFQKGLDLQVQNIIVTTAFRLDPRCLVWSSQECWPELSCQWSF